MDAEIEQLLVDPHWYLHGIDVRDPGWRPVARFVRLAPEDFHELYWTLREVVVPRGREIRELALDRLLDVPIPAARPIRYVAHSAYCGSTLLARALARWPKVLTLFEPRVLFDLQRWLGSRRVLFGRAVPDAQLPALVALVRALLGRAPTTDHVVLVKVHAGCNSLLPHLLGDDHSPALFLHDELAHFLAQVLKSPERRTQLERLRDAGLLGLERFGRRGGGELSVAEAAATVWLGQLHRYLELVRDRPSGGLKSLRSTLLLRAPRATVRAAAAHLSLGAEPEGLDAELAAVITTHAKTPDRRFSPAEHDAELVEVGQRYAGEIHQGLDWARRLSASVSLPPALPSPLAVPCDARPLPPLLPPAPAPAWVVRGTGR